MARAASLEQQLAAATRQYDSDLLAAEQLAVAAREAALVAAQQEFAARVAQMREVHERELAAADERLAAVRLDLQVRHGV